MINMPRKYKVLQCPHCSELTYLPLDVRQNSCPWCKSKITLHELKGTIVHNIQEAQQRVQEQHQALHGLIHRCINHQPAQQVLQILRSYQSDSPQWLPIHEIFQLSIEAGLLPKEVHEAIDILNAEGFLEKREDTIRAIPLN